MIFYPQERLALFIDGSNLYAAARALRFDIDYNGSIDFGEMHGLAPLDPRLGSLLRVVCAAAAGFAVAQAITWRPLACWA